MPCEHFPSEHSPGEGPPREYFDTVIDARRLAAGLDDPRLVVIDCRHDMGRPEWGARAFAAGHIPGAAFAHLDRDLSAPVRADSGRHPLPDPQRLAALLGSIGVGPQVQVVAYDQGNGAFAARLWWLLRWLGHERVAVLNGGLAAWQAAGLPLSDGPMAGGTATVGGPAVIGDTGAMPRPRSAGSGGFIGAPAAALLVDTAQVQRGLAQGSILLVDARAADRFAGENETIDAVAGHVPGARNHPFTRNLDAQGGLLPAAELARHWRLTLAGAAPAQVVAMCGSGVTACHNLLALQIAGLPGARLYAGSFSEWIRDPGRAVATGTVA